MKGWIRWTCAGCVVSLALGGSLAHAEGGRITFVGAVVTPTCDSGDGQTFTPRVARSGCGLVASGSAAYASTYRQEITSVGQAARESPDRLLSYFAGYAGSDGVQLITRTYD